MATVAGRVWRYRLLIHKIYAAVISLCLNYTRYPGQDSNRQRLRSAYTEAREHTVCRASALSVRSVSLIPLEWGESGWCRAVSWDKKSRSWILDFEFATCERPKLDRTSVAHSSSVLTVYILSYVRVPMCITRKVKIGIKSLVNSGIQFIILKIRCIRENDWHIVSTYVCTFQNHIIPSVSLKFLSAALSRLRARESC